jgi:hypothetical protein
MSIDKELGQSFDDAVQHADPSVQYAEAFMDGEKQVTVTTRNGQKITYQIGQEFNYGQ